MKRTLAIIVTSLGLYGCASAQPAPAVGDRPEGRPDADGAPGLRSDRPRDERRGDDRRRPMEDGWRQWRGEEVTVTFLGVEASPLDPQTRSQIKIPAESGLQINFVSDDSPAKAAGLQQHDVLVKLDEQVLYNPPQLMAMIRAHKAGDEVKLSIVRQGETKTITAKLRERKTQMGPPFGAGGPMGMMGMMPPGGPPMGMEPGMRPDGAAVRSLVVSDDAMKVEVKNVEGKITLTATGKDGAAIFTGPIDTAEQRAGLPENVKARLNELAMDQLVKTLKQPSPVRFPRMDGRGPDRPRDGRGPREDGQGREGREGPRPGMPGMPGMPGGGPQPGGPMGPGMQPDMPPGGPRPPGGSI